MIRLVLPDDDAACAVPLAIDRGIVLIHNLTTRRPARRAVQMKEVFIAAPGLAGA